MKKFLLFLILSLLFLFIPTQIINAQSTVSSNCVTTDIGGNATPATLPSNCTSPNSSSGLTNLPSNQSAGDALVSAGEALHKAYADCTNTINDKAVGDWSPYEPCIDNDLLSSGYTQAAITNTKNEVAGTNIGCGTQCLGFVHLALILAFQGADNSLNQPCSAYGVIFNSTCNQYGDVHQVNDYTQSFIIINGAGKYLPVGKGVIPQPGDIGVAEPYNDEGVKGAGHILIVKSVEGLLKFTGLESNWDEDCGTTDTNPHPNTDYYFYRKA